MMKCRALDEMRICVLDKKNKKTKRPLPPTPKPTKNKQANKKNHITTKQKTIKEKQKQSKRNDRCYFSPDQETKIKPRNDI